MVMSRVTQLREKAEQALGLPPIEKLGQLLTEENTRRIDTILRRLEKLSRNQESLVIARQLLEMVERMAQSGDLQRLDSTLERLDSIVSKLPKGKRGQDMLGGLQSILATLDEKIEKVQKLAETILSSEE